MTLPSITHAVLLDGDELSALLEIGRGTLVRPISATLRSEVGLFSRDSSQVEGTGSVVEVTPHKSHEDGGRSYIWRFEGCVRLPQPLRVDLKGGPIWTRLGLEHRRSLVDDGSPAVFTTRDDIGIQLGGFEEIPNPTSTTAESTSEPETNEALDLVEEVDVDPAETIRQIPEEEDEELGFAPTPVVAGSALVSRAEEEPLELSEAADLAESASSLEDAVKSAPAETADETPAADEAVEPDTPGIEAARARAFAMVPTTRLEVDEATQLLIRLRDEEIKQTFPAVPPQHGILRRRMLQALLDEGVLTQEDYRSRIPADLRRTTDPQHTEAYLDPILAILNMTE